jgi:hypothetical protein
MRKIETPQKKEKSGEGIKEDQRRGEMQSLGRISDDVEAGEG